MIKVENATNGVDPAQVGKRVSKPELVSRILYKQPYKSNERTQTAVVRPLHTHQKSHHDGHDRTDFGMETAHILHPIQEPSKQSRFSEEGNESQELESRSEKPFTKPRHYTILNMPENRLKLAVILLMIVFILGLINGVNSLIQGTKEGIGSDIDKPDYVDIHGRVIENLTGRPVANVKVTVQETSQSTQTDNDGQYFIPNVKSGVHNIMVEAPGYVDIVKKVTVDPELMGIINFELDEGAGTINMDESVLLREPEEYEKINSFAIIIIIFACFGLLAVVLAHRRMFFYLCSFSAFLSVLSFGLGIGSILGLIAFILIVFSNAGFKKFRPELRT